MKSGAKCIVRTINPCIPETLARPSKVQKIVTAEVDQSCPSVGTHWAPKAVCVKVCSQRELRKTCPPKIVECPKTVEKKASKSMLQRICKALWLLTKGGIAAGLVYWTNSEGFWAKSSETEELYYRALTTVAPAESNQSEDTLMSPFEKMKFSIIQCYNRTMYTVGSSIVDSIVLLQRRIQDALCASPHDEGCEKVNIK